jgi:DNA-binding winged helix-turn-helix (wHTH) protein
MRLASTHPAPEREKCIRIHPVQYIFSEFVLDSGAGELRRDDAPIDLRPKLYGLLHFLLENRGRLVSKEEILDAVWRDVHVSDGSLNRTVAELRQILGDDSRKPHLIETVPRRGYKFIGDVTISTARSAKLMLLLADRVIPLPAGEHIVGRTPECSVQIVAPSVSRRHARITVTAEGASIEDLGSLNGTWIGERRIAGQERLRDGDEIRIGKERLRLVSEGTLRARTEPAI